MKKEDYEMFERYNKTIERKGLRLHYSSFSVNGDPDYFDVYFEKYNRLEKRWVFIFNVTYCTKTAKASLEKARKVLADMERFIEPYDTIFSKYYCQIKK